jgi:outer membrane lipoprotein-sorting protein
LLFGRHLFDGTAVMRTVLVARPLALAVAAWALCSPAPAAARGPSRSAVRQEAACARATGAALLEAVQRRYRGQAVAARFEQTYVDAVLGPRAKEAGGLWLDGQGRMRFAYEAPERKLFVFDGNAASFEETAARQVTVLDHFDQSRGAAALGLLAGHVAPGEVFRLDPRAAQAPSAAGEAVLAIRPAQSDAAFARAELRVRRRDCLVIGVTVVDAVGNQSVYALGHVARGADMPADAFVRRVPQGFEVLHVDAAKEVSPAAPHSAR